MSSLARLLGRGLAVYGALSSASAAMTESNTTDGIEVSYKEPGICEMTPGVKSYSGYVTLPSTPRQPYAQKVFFWFFEARDSPEGAPLSIWLQGGPGAPSIDQALELNGPCIVQADSNSTVPNPWSWNNHVNLLYIDQPVQAGFSYDEATPGLVDMIAGAITVGGGSSGSSNYTAREGIFASQDVTKAPITTASAVEVLWEFTQAWMKEFQQYRRDKISVWSQSYGGHYAPALANLLHTRSTAEKRLANGVRRRGCQEDGYLDIDVDSVGIINGFIDFDIQSRYFPSFAINNTYGIQAYDPVVADSAYANYTRPGGCKEQIAACTAVTPNGYRDQDGSDEAATQVCGTAFEYCWTNVYAAYDALSGRDWFDIAHLMPVSFPTSYSAGYLTKKWVLEALGAEVDYTQSSVPVGTGFMATGDFVYGGFLEDIETLLDDGVKVALIHGDRDFRCNWVAGEAVSLAAEYGESSAFRAAGYEEISTNESYVGGMVKQKGKFSFSRVFQAGHQVSSYQPETAYKIFMRTVFAQDVATGTVSLADNPDYESQGPASVFDIKNELPAQPDPLCYVLRAPLQLSCTPEQLEALRDGTAVVEDDVVISPAAVRP
ncbi:hypothetical protein DL764_001915 [Monosporascus ibericus]|uniref:Carboxypeptidase n=1 Tax=Monosporascus ibericus TaxID=155417 RepID=A0A4Q4TR04_9PEZI|nr:hypothetical protein DL764_001915 [Monosporascus ibericus]